MNRMWFLLITFCMFMVLVIIPSANAAIVINDVARHVTARSSAGSDSVASDLEGSFDEDVSVGTPFLNDYNFASASQDSNVLSTSYSGEGAIEAEFYQEPSGLADSFFDVMFEIDAPTNYQLQGSISVTGDASSGAGFAAFLFAGPGISVDKNVGLFESTNWDMSGVLGVGAYELMAHAHSEGNLSVNGYQMVVGEWGFSLTLTPDNPPPPPRVPEPASLVMWMLLSMAVCGGVCRHRKRR